MKSNICLRRMLILVLIACICFFACEKKKQEGKVIVTEKEFLTEKDGKFTFSLNVKGKVKNIGGVDVKNIVVTGRCKNCDERMISGE